MSDEKRNRAAARPSHVNARGGGGGDGEKDWVDADAKHLWHPYTQHGVDRTFLPVVRASGATLELADGRTLIDAISSWWTCLHGHGHPALVEAIRRQAAELDHVLFAGTTHEPAARLATELLAHTPEGLTRLFFSDNGSTAVEVALKMSYQAWVHRGEPERTTFVALEGAYHGDTFGAMSVGDPDPFFTDYAPLLFDVKRVPADGERVRALLAELDGRVAAVVLEPLLQGAAGMRIHPAAFVREVRDACDAHGVHLIADEVFTGFGRTGALFACDRADVAPDLLCLAKGLTAGMLPMAVTLATEEIFEAFLHDERSRFFPHGHTFTANPIGCALARASLALAIENDVPVRFELIGERIAAYLREGLGASTAEALGLRQLGGVVALDLEPPPGEAPGYLASRTPLLRAAAVERGVLLRPLGNVLYAVPPACTSGEECDAIAQAMVELVRDV